MGVKMFFKRKIDKLINVEEAENRFKKEIEEEQFNAKDIAAMMIAAILVFLPALILVIAVFLFVIWFFFLRFT